MDLPPLYADGGQKVYRCTVKVNNPHPSQAELKKGRVSVVGKAQVSCPNAGKTLKVYVQGYLARSTSYNKKNLRIVDSNAGTLVIKPGKTGTLMVPPPKSTAHYKGGYWYRMSVSARIVGESRIAPIGAKASGMVWVKN
ncbi:hypothetical protein [Leucobacter manosquensis]|uniref:Uncharacterized protein n=1 Tax=Leucobacter manosquensis TaxID=2810611 RepID=A0ABS5M6Y3_9MICO|nr:hypothetical protein [Leucobacter manosquensis]MBS3182964.1 hypothetical protein [Leucobacter manosquensis]